MCRLLVLIVTAATVGLVHSEPQSSILISKPTDSKNSNVISNELRDFLIDFEHATSKDLISALTGGNTINTPTLSDWKLALYFMYKYKEVVLFELIDVYPSLQDNENKILIHNAVMNLLEDHKTDNRILMLFDIKNGNFNLRPHLKMLVKCNPYLALMSWVNDTENVSDDSHNAQYGSERLVPMIISNNLTDILMVINKYDESYWASLLPETFESDSNTNLFLATIEESFLKNCDQIDFPKLVAFIENIPNDSIGNNVKKTILYNALLTAAKAEGDSEILAHYFDVALSFDGFSQNSYIENHYFNNFIKSMKDKYTGCYKSVMHTDNNAFMIKAEKYAEYLYTQPVISQRVFKSNPSDISANIYTPIFSWRHVNKTIGFQWEIKREKNLFWLKSIEFDRYMDTTRCDHINSNGNVALPDMAIKILPYRADSGLCRIMNFNTKQFLFVGNDDSAEDDERRTIFCGNPKFGLDQGMFNWRFEEFNSLV